ncbi:MAG: hypothetical protein WCA50_18390 [Candidatus Sulfotelmatobacter sp.]
MTTSQSDPKNIFDLNGDWVVSDLKRALDKLPTRGVNLDGCVEVAAAYYGLPPGWIGREVKVQWDELYVRILDPKNGLLLREHVRQKRG